MLPPNTRLKVAALLLEEALCCLVFSTSAAAYARFVRRQHMKQLHGPSFKTRSLVVVTTAILSACVVRVRAKIADPAFPRAGMCPEAVAVFATPTAIGRKYIEVAQLSTGPFGGDFRPSAAQVEDAERKKAAQLGANGIILRHALGGHELRYDDAVAIFIPEDSARAAGLCATPPSAQ